MVFNETEQARMEQALASFLTRRRPPPEMRSEVDLSFRVTERDIELFEIRPKWRGKPGEIVEHPVAKATYVRTRQTWGVYWRRQDLKWHRYEPVPEVNSIEEFCKLVDEDAYGCFFG